MCQPNVQHSRPAVNFDSALGKILQIVEFCAVWLGLNVRLRIASSLGALTYNFNCGCQAPAESGPTVSCINTVNNRLSRVVRIVCCAYTFDMAVGTVSGLLFANLRDYKRCHCVLLLNFSFDEKTFRVSRSMASACDNRNRRDSGDEAQYQRGLG